MGLIFSFVLHWRESLDGNGMDTWVYGVTHSMRLNIMIFKHAVIGENTVITPAMVNFDEK